MLRFNVAGPQEPDRFDSSGVLANAQFASSIMAQGGFKGIVLDTGVLSTLCGTVFYYNTQPQKASHSFRQYQAQARLVGGQFMQCLHAQI